MRLREGRRDRKEAEHHAHASRIPDLSALEPAGEILETAVVVPAAEGRQGIVAIRVSPRDGSHVADRIHRFDPRIPRTRFDDALPNEWTPLYRRGSGDARRKGCAIRRCRWRRCAPLRLRASGSVDRMERHRPIERRRPMSVQRKTIARIHPDAAVDEKQKLALDVLLGLSETPKRISSKYIYDEEGSRIFQEIMRLPEYYPTRCEREILRSHKGAILEPIKEEAFELVELGAGDGSKTEVLLRHFAESSARFRYVPVDISESSQQGLCDTLEERMPGLSVLAIVAEYFDALQWLTANEKERKLVLFLGSNIGNFSRSQTRVFLRSMWNALNPGDRVLIGFDLKKDIDVLLDAYNDAAGTTARFNKNILRRINRELGGDFDLSKFRHYATYDVFSGAMESYLVSLETQVVTIREMQERFEFAPWEPIHTEYSYKYLESDIERIAAEAGFVIEGQFFDDRRYFVDSLWRVEKPVAEDGMTRQ